MTLSLAVWQLHPNYSSCLFASRKTCLQTQPLGSTFPPRCPRLLPLEPTRTLFLWPTRALAPEAAASLPESEFPEPRNHSMWPLCNYGQNFVTLTKCWRIVIRILWPHGQRILITILTKLLSEFLTKWQNFHSSKFSNWCKMNILFQHRPTTQFQYTMELTYSYTPRSNRTCSL